ncbi:MAG: choice-of-anchor V domain-containing protein [Myxococcaceae bacterium]
MTRILVALSVVTASVAFAHSTGEVSLSSAGCNGCHFGGSAPTVTLVPSATTVRAGATLDLTVTVSATNKNTSNVGYAGFNLFASGGTFTAPGSGARIQSNQITHNTPKMESGGTITWSGNVWRAPLQAGTITFGLWGNSVNRNNVESGDLANSSAITKTVTVTCDTQAETCAGKSCGDVTDNCNQTVSCGTCSGSDVCNASNVCGPPGVDAGTVDAGIPDAGSGGGAGGGAGGGSGGGVGGGTGGGGGTTAIPDGGVVEGPDAAGGCSCNATQGGVFALMALGALLLRANKRRAV